jgi:hypothetical protein
MVTNGVGLPVRGADFNGREAFVSLASEDRSSAPPRRIDKAYRMAVIKGDSHGIQNLLA